MVTSLRRELRRASALTVMMGCFLGVLSFVEGSLTLALLAVFLFSCAFRALRPVEPHSNNCLAPEAHIFKDRLVATVGELCLLCALWRFATTFCPSPQNAVFFGLAVSAQLCAWLAIWSRNPSWTVLEYCLWFVLSLFLLWHVAGHQLSWCFFVFFGGLLLFYWNFLGLEIYRYAHQDQSLLQPSVFVCNHDETAEFWSQEKAWLRVYFELAPVLVVVFAVSISSAPWSFSSSISSTRGAASGCVKSP